MGGAALANVLTIWPLVRTPKARAASELMSEPLGAAAAAFKIDL